MSESFLPERKRIGDETPFRRKLWYAEHRDHNDILRQIPDFPNKVVRVQSLERALGSVAWDLIKNASKRQQVGEYLKVFNANKERLRELRDKYGIAVPDIDLILGKDDKGKEAVFMVVDKIEGDNLTEIDKFPPGTASQFDVFFAALFQYLLDANRDKFPVLSDIGHLFQYVYGHRAGKNGKSIYLVDVEPALCYPRESHFGQTLWIMASELISGMNSVEERLGGIKLKRAREKLNEVSREIFRIKN